MTLRGSLWDKLETFFVVSLITGLVWLYAEGENLDDYTEPVRVRFVGSAGIDLAITPREAVTIEVTFKASKSQLEDFKALTAQGPIALDAPDASATSVVRRPVNLAAVLNKSGLDVIGINILTAEPPNREVTVQHLVTEELPVRVEYGERGELRFAKPPAADPLAVSVTLPMELAQSTGGRAVIARIDSAELRGLPVGVAQTLDVKLELPPDLQNPWQQIAPAQTTVGFTILKQTDTTEVSRVPINISLPPLMLKRYAIDLPADQQTLPKVVVEGPSDEIQRIIAQPTLIRAEIRLTGDDLARGATTATVFVSTPPGVTVTDPPPPITVPVTITATNGQP